MKVYEALAKAFAAEGVTDVFGMMGDANLYWIDRLDKLGVKTYEVRHESGALNMAQGYARITGKVGVCTTTSGPGVTQLATSMTIASRAQTPIVVFAGESPTADDDYVQRINQERFAEAIEAGFVRVLSGENVLDAVQKAFYRAKLESRPIMLSVPMDVQQKTMDDDAMDDYVPSSQVLQIKRTMPDPADVVAAADLIAASEKPVILVGRGAIASDAGQAVLELAHRTGALITTTLMAKNWLNDDPYHAGISGTYGTRTALELFQDADVVIAVGASLNKHTTAAGYLYPGARYVHLDTRRHVMLGGGGSADIYLQTDATLGVEALSKELASRDHSATGYRTEDVKLRLAQAYDDPETYELQPGTVDPREVCLMLDKMMPSNVGLVLGSGQNVCFSTMLFNEPRDLLLPNQFFGSIGQGITSTIGAAVGSGKPCFLMDGDVSLMMYLSEFETACRYRLPVMIVILNDQAMGAELHKMRVHGLDSDLAELTTPDLGKVAVALGGRGRLARTLDDVRDAAQEFLDSPAPTIIDVRISNNVISVPYRRLHYGQDA
jgi:thiamine pyrophosphate-dependent acetolactate synthase large subunit-like protein